MAKPTVAKAPSRIPQDVQQDIIALAVLTRQLNEIQKAVEIRRHRIATALAGAVRAVRA